MTHGEALDVLSKHQQWRKGSHQVETDSKNLTEALEVAINLLKEELSYCQCPRPFPNQKGPVFECMNCDKQMK